MKRYIRSSEASKAQTIAELSGYKGTHLGKAANEAIERIESGEIQSFEWFDLVNDFERIEDAAALIEDAIGMIPEIDLVGGYDANDAYSYHVYFACPYDYLIGVRDHASGESLLPAEKVKAHYINQYAKVIKQQYSDSLKRNRLETPGQFADSLADTSRPLRLDAAITDESKFRNFIIDKVTATYRRNKKKFDA